LEPDEVVVCLRQVSAIGRLDDVKGEFHHDVALRILDVGDFVAEPRAQLGIFDRHGAIDAERMASRVGDIVGEGAERKGVLVDITRIANQRLDEIS